MRARSLGCTRRPGSGDEPLQQRRLRDQATFVVQRATDHEAQSVRVARRRLGLGRAAVPARRARARRRRRSTSTSAAGSSGASPSTLIGSQEVPDPSSAMIERSRVRSTISSRCAAIGSDDTVAGALARSSAVTPASAGATRAISSVTSSTVARSRSRPSRSASSAAMRQSSIAVPSGATLRPTRCTRPSRFVTVPAFSPHSVHGRNTSARCVDSDSNAVDRDDRVDRVERAPRERGVGEVADRIGADAAPARGSCRRPRRAGCPRRRARARRGRAPHCSVNQSRPASSVVRPGQEARREAGVERAVHVAAPQRRQEPHVVHAARARPRRRRPSRRLAARLPRPTITTTGPARPSATRRDLVVHARGDRFARNGARDDGRVRPTARARPARGRRAARRARARPGAGAGRAPAPGRAGRGRARRSRSRGRGRRSRPAAMPSTKSAGRPSPSCASTLSVPITPLASIDQTYASSFVPRAPPSTAIDAGAVQLLGLLDRVGRAVERVGPRHLAPRAALADLRLEQPALGVHPLEAVAALVAQPAVVHRLGVDAEQPHEPVRRRLHRAAALHRARGARRLDRREVPGPGPEAVLARGERADRADLHGVAREVRVERLLFEVQDLHAIAAVDEVDERVARDLVGEADAPRALDAALAVEQHELAQRDRLREVALLLDEARLARPERERLVLQRALAAAVAHRAVERVVDRAGTRARRLGSASRRRSASARPCRR